MTAKRPPLTPTPDPVFDAALALQAEYCQWRLEMGMQPLPEELEEFKEWVLLLFIWKGGGMVAPFGVEDAP